MSDKLGVIGHLLPRVSSLLIGGGMLFTFLAAQGHSVGSSLLEADQLGCGARATSRRPNGSGCEIVLPTDVVVASRVRQQTPNTWCARRTSIEDTEWGAAGVGLDIGPDTAASFAEIIRSSATVFWNGPMGVFEFPAFAAGTKTVAQALTEAAGRRHGAHGGRWRGLGGRRARPGIPRRPIRPHIDRGRGEPGVPRGQASPGSGGTRMAVTTPAGGRVPLIAGNWKMNLDHLQAIAFVQKLAWSLKDAHHDFADVEVAVFPPFTDLAVGADPRLGGQARDRIRRARMSRSTSPARTPVRSPPRSWRRSECRYVIIGHSERRSLHGETDEQVAAKVAAALAHGLIPVICVGETAEDREAHGPSAVPVAQLRAALAGGRRPVPTVVVAYEPVWAIGSGQPATPEQAEQVAAALRGVLVEALGQDRRRGHSDPLRRFGQVRQHRRLHARAEPRRRLGRRGEPRHRRVRQHRAVPQARRGLIAAIRRAKLYWSAVRMQL